MLYHLFYPLATQFKLFNIFKYLTFRTIYAMITALVVCFVIGPGGTIVAAPHRPWGIPLEALYAELRARPDEAAAILARHVDERAFRAWAAKLRR